MKPFKCLLQLYMNKNRKLFIIPIHGLIMIRLKKFGKDVRSCLKGASESFVSSPFGTTKTFAFPTTAGIAIGLADAGVSCGKKVVERRKIEKEACGALRRSDFKKIKDLGIVYNSRNHGSTKRMLNTCPRLQKGEKQEDSLKGKSPLGY